ncbi:YeiH family protein [Kibdelosporangium persicum]|uniref:Sulfate exporter family transporter n=1 Tax=Kibdelosporangium persicum TaxID=2698649 RepID=A0ABX2F2C9_9PSEU|nr:putative sulfate exporter family transporter [Kibdelosporangium persicum]NRN65471.1 putative sulfate exporter family transporter [Kibdelosporangium persicum]
MWVALAGAVVALVVNHFVPVLSALTVAVLIGVLVPVRADLQHATRRFLRAGVVLLGLQLSLAQITDLGFGTVLAVVVTVLAGFFGTLALARWIGVSRGLGLMVATGFSICGASAIVAMDSVARTDKEDVAASVTLVTLYGSAAIALVPLIGRGMGSEFLGKWAGLSVHEVAQVVAAASPAGAAAVGAAVVVKLTRVVLLAPIVAGVGFFQRQDGPKPPAVPLFAVGFLAMVLVRSAGILPGPVLDGAKVTTTTLLAAAMFGLGTTVRIGKLVRAGKKGLVLGALSTVLVGGVAFGSLILI